MKCYLCGSEAFNLLFEYDRPDKYESWQGLKRIRRTWETCKNCGFIQSDRNYPLSAVEKIYKEGYRNPKFRGEDIGVTFNKVMGLAESENKERCGWVCNRTTPGTLLDIGSGFGVFPFEMSRRGYAAECVEENSISIKFINNDLEIKCYDRIPKKRYDTVSLVHVLEHIEDPIGFLKQIRRNVKRDLFVEVPNSIEFFYLNKDHDEFNSCHTKFYSPVSLYTVLKKSGWTIINATVKHYKDRNLSRILVLCR